jgi:hypothetical protein
MNKKQLYKKQTSLQDLNMGIMAAFEYRIEAVECIIANA